MKSQDGTDYAQNYDVIVKWLAAALRGETLDVLGVQTGRIEEVFGFEPVDLAVRAGRVDVMARDETGAMYHIEEQRNLTKSDMYRFASYHFQGAKQWGPILTDIILASGEVYAGEKIITTNSGEYKPIVIDFTKRDGRKRLAEIREAIKARTFDTWIELVFLPLYGKEKGTARSEMVEQVLRFESELYHAEKLSARLLAATLILSNKLIDKHVLRQIWEEIKMLDILEIAKEEGLKEGIREGKALGLQEGKALVVETTRDMVMDTLIERFNAVPTRILEQIRAIQNLDAIKGLHRQAIKCQTLQEFESILQQVI
jgi:hypothetical protein